MLPHAISANWRTGEENHKRATIHCWFWNSMLRMNDKQHSCVSRRASLPFGHYTHVLRGLPPQGIHRMIPACRPIRTRAEIKTCVSDSQPSVRGSRVSSPWWYSNESVSKKNWFGWCSWQVNRSTLRLLKKNPEGMKSIWEHSCSCRSDEVLFAAELLPEVEEVLRSERSKNSVYKYFVTS